MEIVLPPISKRKAVRISCGLNTCPSNAFNTVRDEMRVGEPRDFQHDKDMIHVATPSSKMVRKMFLLRQLMVNMKVTEGGRHGS